MSTNLMSASHQWASRPVDQTFWGLHDMADAARKLKEQSRERTTDAASIRAVAHKPAGHDSPELFITGSKGDTMFGLTHWSGGQLCRYADAPADYIRGLPADLAAANINHGLARYHGDKAQLMLAQGDDGAYALRSMTSDYSRLWNVDIIEALKPALDAGWMVPPARPSPSRDDPRARLATPEDIVPGQDSFGLAVKAGDLIAPAGCYASDRDAFIFMVNPNRVVDVDGSGNLMRGFFLYNSEVGAGAFKVQTFYLESICSNHICWGAKGLQTFRLVHKGDNFADFGQRLGRELGQLSDADTTAERNMVASARRYIIGKDRLETVNTLFANRQLGLSRTTIEAAYDMAEQWEHTAKSSPNTAWSMVHGLTRFSQTMPNADQRATLDNAAGKLLAIASK